MTHRDFHIGDALSVVKGTLLSPRGMEGVYDILNFMTGEDLMTHQLPRVSREVAPVLLRKHFWLAYVDVDGITPENFRERLDKIIDEYGYVVTLEPMAPGEHERIDAMSELVEMKHPDDIITIVCGDEPGKPR